MMRVEPSEPGIGAAPGFGNGLSGVPPAPDEADTWVLQNDAAARTGFSVSAVRKWRRQGLVADRKVATANGFERVEVRLEDVLARAALQPDRRRPDEDQGHQAEVPAGTVNIALRDLETLFERMVDAERRAGRLEAELHSAQAMAKFSYGQLAELRRQLDAHVRRTAQVPQAEPTAAPPPAPAAFPPPCPGTESPVVGPPPVRSAAASAPGGMAPVRTGTGSPGAGTGPVRTGTASVRTLAPGTQPVHPVAEGPAPRPATLEEASAALRAAYARLDEYRRERTISPDRERQRHHDLAAYDTALMTACSLLGIPAGPAGRPISVQDRSALTKALARTGLDVRARGTDGPGPEPARRLPRRRN